MRTQSMNHLALFSVYLLHQQLYRKSGSVKDPYPIRCDMPRMIFDYPF